MTLWFSLGTTPTPISEMAIGEVIDPIEALNTGLASFWGKSQGWAPVAAAGLLSKSRLDWQASLSGSLRLWIRDVPNALAQGDLILAWANLGSLLEGTLKTLLSIYYETYKTDLEHLKKAGAFDHKKQEPKDPGVLTLEPLRQYCKSGDLLGADGDALLELVQRRRNAVHAFVDRPIGNGLEFQQAVRDYLAMLRRVNERLPYPDDICTPHDI